MKLAVLGDIHANFVALQKVAAHVERWQPDAVVVAGDIVNRGPQPLECLQFVLAKQQTDGWLVVRGNHEDYVISFADPDTPCNGLEFEIFRGAYWTYQKLKCDVTGLKAMPFQVDLAGPDRTKIQVVHASIHHNRDGIFPTNTNAQIRQKIYFPDQQPPDLFCTAHTHWPLIRSIDSSLVVNVGAVGLPFDGDPRAAYGQFVYRQGQWQANIIRLDYDRKQAAKVYFDSGFIAESGPVTRLIYDEFLIAQPHLFRWTQLYHSPIVNGEITIDEAVTTYLAERK